MEINTQPLLAFKVSGIKILPINSIVMRTPLALSGARASGG